MIIETERLVLRPFKTADAPDVLEYLKEPAVHCFADMKLDSIDDAKKKMRSRARDKEYYFAIVLKETGKVIGEVFGGPESSDPTGEDEDTVSPGVRVPYLRMLSIMRSISSPLWILKGCSLNG